MINIISDLVNGLIVAFLIWFVKLIVQKISRFIIDIANGFNITGCWYAEHGTYIDESKHGIEIIYIWQKGENIKYRMEQYTNYDSVKRITRGNGIMKAGNVSSYYYPLERNSKLIGCLNFSVKTKSASEIFLEGCFYEFDERKKQYNFVNYPDDYYKMYKIDLTFKRKIKLKYFKDVFSSYDEVKKYVESNPRI
ncbi:MAG: hypothetical protein ACI4EJ_07745 [Bacteroides sp.]